ncbi:uncharacterized protein LOC126589695 [Malus sylvestris]|uniref:uncharacterized protein LOC126589695 n=1 Tax=Malus sylvestris TaxID=3752 RepID=UPI0021ACD6FD|nr:uncharacterized protein LOC126589695 [Malus sylvestris]
MGHIALECYHRNNFSYQARIMDTWATHHMSANVNALSNVNPYNGDEKIIIGNGEDKASRVILYQGMSDGGELFKILVNVLANSFASRLSRCAALLGKKIHTTVWHQRLGHPSKEVLAVMLKDLNISVNKDSCQLVCSCIQGKMTRQVISC